MCRIHYFASYALISAFLCGCVGFVVVQPTESTIENPTTADTARRDFWLKRRSELSEDENNRTNAFINQVPFLSPGKSDKSGFISDWGNPDEIVKKNEANEEWVYKKRLWCGVVPIWILAIPLVLPLCEGFDRVEFDDDQATSLKVKRSSLSGCIFFLPAGGSCDL